MTEFTITKLQTLDGQENIAFECNLYASRTAIAKVSNTGTGGCHHYDWKNSELRKKYEAQVTDEIIWELIDEKLPDRVVEIPIDIIKDRLRAEKKLVETCDAIAQLMGDGWTVYPGMGSTIAVGHHGDGFEFRCFISLAENPAYHTHDLNVGMRVPVEVHLTDDEIQHLGIPDFDLRTKTAIDIVVVLREKLEYLKSILPALRDRKAIEQDKFNRIRQAGDEVAQQLGIPIQYTTNGRREDGFSIRRELDKGFGECFSIEVGAHTYADGTSRFSLSACRISDEKLLKLLEYAKHLDLF